MHGSMIMASFLVHVLKLWFIRDNDVIGFLLSVVILLFLLSFELEYGYSS